MGQGKVRIVEYVIVDQEEIQVECPGRIRERPNAAKLCLDSQQSMEEIGRSQGRDEPCDGVEIGRLVGIANRLGHVER